MLSHHIEAVSTNHNTSRYMELMLRSLFARHPQGLDLSLTLYDNASQDDMTGLLAYAAGRNIPILPSGFSIQIKNNSHGEVLRSWARARSCCTA